MDEQLAAKIRESLVNGKLPCPVALKLANDLDISPKRIGDITNEMGIKVSSCQLGCFK